MPGLSITTSSWDKLVHRVLCCEKQTGLCLQAKILSKSNWVINCLNSHCLHALQICVLNCWADLVQYAHYHCLKFDLQFCGCWNIIKNCKKKPMVILCPMYKNNQAHRFGYECVSCWKFQQKFENIKMDTLMHWRHNQGWSCTRYNSLHPTLPFVIVLSFG